MKQSSSEVMMTSHCENALSSREIDQERIWSRRCESKLIMIPLVLILSTVLSLLSYIWESHYGLNLRDESYLWYGAQRIFYGEMPIRDFSSYDPLRYYWSAAVMKCLGDRGIVTLRFANLLFKITGLVLASVFLVLELKPSGRNILPFIVPVFFLWMFPDYKAYDTTGSIFVVLIIAYLVKNPSSRKLLIVGTAIGLLAMLGRNHAVYALVSTFFAMCYCYVAGERSPLSLKGLLNFLVGIILGYSPILILCVLDLGFATQLVNSVIFIIDTGTNYSLPVPWPWRVKFFEKSLGLILYEVCLGIVFVILALFAAFSLPILFRRRVNGVSTSPMAVASCLTALPYSHYAFSRADSVHLALGIYPLLFGMSLWIASLSLRSRLLALSVFAIVSIVITIPNHKGWLRYRVQEQKVVHVESDTLIVPADLARFLKEITHRVDQVKSKPVRILAAPLPGVYVLFQTKSPIWDIYPLFRRFDEFEEEELLRLQQSAPELVIFPNYEQSKQSTLHFSSTHPRIYQYILDNYQQIYSSEQNKNYSYGFFVKPHLP